MNPHDQQQNKPVPPPAPGPKYFINIEGEEKPWDRDTITVPELIILAGWDTNQQVQEIDLATNETKTLGPNETIELKPGHGFAKKIKFQRG